MTDENIFDEIVSENLSEEEGKLAMNESSDYKIEDQFLKRGYDYDIIQEIINIVMEVGK